MDLKLDHDYTLNPDGSGKVALAWSGAVPGPDFNPADFMTGEVGNARGVDAWGALSCVVDGDRMKFEALAYFPSLSGLRFHCQGFHANVLEYETSLTDAGAFVVANTAPGGPPSEPSGASDDELRARLSEERGKFAQARGFLEGMVGGLVCSATLRLPGTVSAAVNCAKSGPATVRSRFEGDRILEVIGRLMEDDALALRLMKSGKQGPEALAELAGVEGPLRVEAAPPLEPIFDYAAESAAARERFDGLAASLGLGRGPERSKPLANVRVAAAKVVRETDGEREFSPQGESQPCIVLTLCGDLPGPALRADECRLEAAAAFDGRDLLPSDDWDRRIHFPKLTKDGATAFFDVNLRIPPGEIDGFREIRGVVAVQVAGEAVDVDLGIPKLEAGAEGTELGARIERLEAQDEERTGLDLRLAVGVDRVLGVSLRGAKDAEIPMERNGYSSSGDECTLTFTVEGKLPKKPMLTARVVREIRTWLVPFALENVDLLGRPRG